MLKEEELYAVEKKWQDKKFVKEKKELVTIPCQNGLFWLCCYFKLYGSVARYQF